MAVWFLVLKCLILVNRRNEHSNIFSDYDETINYALNDNQKTRKRDLYYYIDWYPYDSRVGELHKLLEFKFQNSQTELKRKFFENIREVKNEIDTKQFNMAKHLQELKNMAQHEREEKERLRIEVERLKKKESDLKEREELMNSLLRNDMKYKTPPLPKIYSYTSDIKAVVDTSGYGSRPISIINNTSNYYSKNTAIPYFETNDYSMNNPEMFIDDDLELGEDTDRVLKLQKDRVDIIEKIESSLANNKEIDMIPALERIRKAGQKPFRISKNLKKSAIKNYERSKKFVDNYYDQSDSLDKLVRFTDESYSKNLMKNGFNTINVHSKKYKLDDSLDRELPSYKLLSYNDL